MPRKKKLDIPPEKLDTLDYFIRRVGVEPEETFRKRKVKYLETVPQPVEKIIDLVEFFERVKRHKADAWQIDFCERLESAFLNRHEKAERAIVHAPAQKGKSVILAQCYPAWILGHDPMHRFALATYNVTRSQAHSRAVIGIMNLPVYHEIFPNPASHVKPKISKERWQTPARAAGGTEAQDSFNPVGLQSGLTGSNFDTLAIDDPYADQKEAFSETVRVNLQNFWEFTVESRLSQYANVFGMFHRYHVQDLAGYLLDKGTFDYWRYSAEADGPYIHDETGQRFDDPIGREPGQLLSPQRFPESYYASKRVNTRVWNSMFQGRPSSEEGDFFNIGKIKAISQDAALQRRQECSHLMRAWDNAATDDGGDWTAGALLGIRPDGRVTIFHAEMVQESTEQRLATQKRIAAIDGPEIPIGIPQDPGSAGKDVVFYTQRELAGYTVVARPTSGSKEERARTFADAVNSGMVEIVEGEWNKQFLRALRDFPLSDFDDPVDAASDAYNHIYSMYRRGLVVKNFRPWNLLPWISFSHRFGDCRKIPANFNIYAAAKITPDASQANSGVIVVRAPENARMGDVLFVAAAYKAWTDDYHELFEWMDAAMQAFCENSEQAIIWLHPDSEEYKPVLSQKLGRMVAMFDGDASAGTAELDWYWKVRPGTVNPFDPELPGVGMYALITDIAQMTAATDEFGMYSLRQEARTWSFNDRGEPNAIGGVMDCLRMVTARFRTAAHPLSVVEAIEASLDENLRLETLNEMPNSAAKDSLIQRRNIELSKAQQTVGRPVRPPHVSRFGRR